MDVDYDYVPISRKRGADALEDLRPPKYSRLELPLPSCLARRRAGRARSQGPRTLRVRFAPQCQLRFLSPEDPDMARHISNPSTVGDITPSTIGSSPVNTVNEQPSTQNSIWDSPYQEISPSPPLQDPVRSSPRESDVDSPLQHASHAGETSVVSSPSVRFSSH